MIDQSVQRDQRPSTRFQRGIRLFAERGHQIARTPGGTYRVPSSTGKGHYVVYIGEFEFCSCPDHRRAKEAGERCKHFHAAGIAAAKLRAARRRRVDEGRREGYLRRMSRSVLLEIALAGEPSAGDGS